MFFSLLAILCGQENRSFQCRRFALRYDTFVLRWTQQLTPCVAHFLHSISILIFLTVKKVNF